MRSSAKKIISTSSISRGNNDVFVRNSFRSLFTLKGAAPRPGYYRRNNKKRPSRPASIDVWSNNLGKKIAVPNNIIADVMATRMSELDNISLCVLAVSGNNAARQETLKRHIMVQDDVSYDTACKTFFKIETKNKEYMLLLTLPYQIGIATALSAAVVSFPLIFDMRMAQWFNENYVTTDVPGAADLETTLEVGMWTWSWMEPCVGQISFVLLCLQYSRAQIANLGVKPYTEAVKTWRAGRLAKAFPDYDAELLINYSEACPIYH